MGRKATTGGVTPKGGKIQLTFEFRGQRVRPLLDMPPSQANLKHAVRHLAEIKVKIKRGTFSFTDEFPNYTRLAEVVSADPGRTFNAVADDFLKSIGDLEHSSKESYRKILKHFWRPKLGQRVFMEILSSELSVIIGSHAWKSNKTRNNNLSVCRRLFEFGYADTPEKRNPADRLKSLKVQRPIPDPYMVDQAERLITHIADKYGPGWGRYFEASFFMGTRPSELIALLWPQVDLQTGSVRIDKARVMGKDKSTTKTASPRDVELCPRALSVFKRQASVTRIAGKEVFCIPTGERIHDLQMTQKIWVASHKVLGIRYREPYQCRHTSVTWNLLIGKNLLWVAEQHGHSPAVALKVYAKWMKGTTEADIHKIKVAMGYEKSGPTIELVARDSGFATYLPLQPALNHLTDWKDYEITGGERGIRTLGDNEDDQ